MSLSDASFEDFSEEPERKVWKCPRFWKLTCFIVMYFNGCLMIIMLNIFAYLKLLKGRIQLFK